MNELFLMAEEEMKDLKHPYVGTEHFLLAFLKKYNSFYLNYEDFKDYVIKVIGKSNICSEYILYTPILRRIKNDCQNLATIATNTGSTAASTDDTATNTLNTYNKVVTIASDTTQMRADMSTIIGLLQDIYAKMGGNV